MIPVNIANEEKKFHPSVARALEIHYVSQAQIPLLQPWSKDDHASRKPEFDPHSCV